jgi:predicted DNA-binding transcriptional regulator YafY
MAAIVAVMRASRLVSILLLLQTRGRLTAHQLAAELEVSVRTIYRDVEALNAAGVPVYGDAGPAGGYQLLAGYRTRLTGLTAAEAEALVLAGVPQAAGELGLGTVVAAAQLKVQAALPAELRERSARIAERFLLDTPGWYADGDDAPFLPAVAAAVWEQHPVEISYHRWAAPTEVTRLVEPHGIVLKGGRWYLVGRAAGQLRTYRVSQISALVTAPGRFDREPGFELSSYWAGQISDFRDRLYQGEARIRLSPAGRVRLAEVLSGPVAAAADASASPPGPDGWVTAVIPIESLRHAEGELLRLGAEVEVLEPASLRGRLEVTAASLARLYTPG